MAVHLSGLVLLCFPLKELCYIPGSDAQAPQMFDIYIQSSACRVVYMIPRAYIDDI